MTAPDRAAIIAAWRTVIGVIEQHEALPFPVMAADRVAFYLFGRRARPEMAALEAALPCEFTASVQGDDYVLTGKIGSLTVVILAKAVLVAEKRVTGTRVVEDVEWVRLEPESNEGDK